MKSVWEKDAGGIRFEALHESKHTDVLIIGGGIAGILTAYCLRRAGVDCMLVEADRICSRTTKNTTAKITLQHGLLYDRLIRRYGEERAGLYLKAQKLACKEYERLCERIPCSYEKKDSYVYATTPNKDLEKEVLALNRLGEHAEFVSHSALPFEIAGAVRVRAQAQFHPLRFLYGIAKDLPIYENTKVLELSPHRAKTAEGEITCERIVIATHFPILNKHGGYYLKMYQDRSYVLALDGAPDVRGMYVEATGKGLSFRNAKGLLLLGGGAHRTGKKGGAWRAADAAAQKYYPTATEVCRFATQDCMTLDGVPYIGQYAKSTPDLYVATGFNKWGMTSAMVSAMLLADLVRGRPNEFASVFSPSRSILHPQLAVNAFESVKGLLTPTAPRCPHLGCALKYNRQEHSWDCPCHGSRFSERGELLDNPATDDL